MDETSTAERLKPNLASGNTRPGFLILIVMMIGAALGLLLLNTYQQNIRTRFQSSAFLQNQLFFLEFQEEQLVLQKGAALETGADVLLVGIEQQKAECRPDHHHDQNQETRPGVS